MVKRYLALTPLDEAIDVMRNAFSCTPRVVTVPLAAAAGRITATPIFSRISVPPRHLSAMDGIAVRAGDTHDASEQHPVTLSDAVRVNTGNVIPEGYDAVIMIEDVQVEEGRYVIRAAVSPWQHVRPVGEDIGESEMILSSLHRIRPFDIGALAAYGIDRVDVFDVSIGLIPTGSELVPLGTLPAPGQVVESNMHMAAAHLQAIGARCVHYPITPDEPDLLRAAVEQGVRENDMLIISAGSSKGTRDYTVGIIGELGEVLIHGVAIKPAKPVIIGKIDGKPVIGMPGYPLACATILREAMEPLLGMYGFSPPVRETVPARLTTTLHSDIGTDEFVLLSVGRIGGGWVAVPQSRGAGVQMSGVRANAYLTIDRNAEGAMAGDEIRASLLVPRESAEESLLITGSHDPALDYLADMTRRQGIAMHTTHTGSMGGLLTLKKGECHAAPMHLLGADGDYNIPYLRKYLPDEELVLLCVAERQQGVVSREGLTLEDITAHTFVNRQKGSGTRMLLDHLLRERGIDSSAITGYDREYTTHLAIALAVKTGEADMGVCVYSAAKALGLPFVPVGTERYELVARKSTLRNDTRLAALFTCVSSDSFKETLTALGGYDIRETGVRRGLP
ncbi:MAG: molybdopterin biosynthesis protein [Methanomicrobiaceae archaeon]|nr:molybdopterin biosynthesis protein [Methanomicrobiaceae archaeon]